MWCKLILCHVISLSHIQQIEATTLSGCLRGKHQVRAEAYEERRLLNNEQSEVLVEQIANEALEARPADRKSLCQMTFNIKGRIPGKNWDFRWCMANGIPQASGSGLDPKRGQNFTPEQVASFNWIMENIDDEFGTIPPEHKWNMDENRCQLGGGRKKTGKKFMFPGWMGRQQQYDTQSDNLELATVLECVSAAGQSMPPAFVLKGGSGRDGNTVLYPELHDVPDGEVAGCIAILIHSGQDLTAVILQAGFY